MAEELRQLEKLRAAAEITRSLAVQMAELLELREAVLRAEEAKARRRPNQRYREIISAAYRAHADAREIEPQLKRRLASKRGNQVLAGAPKLISLENPYEARTGSDMKRAKALPGRLFMQSQWRWKNITVAFWRPGLFSNDRRCRPSLWRRAKAIKNVRFLSDFIGVGMRIPGTTLLILGFVLCFTIDEWEFIGLIPMATGLILLAIAEKKASALALAQAAPFAQMEKQAPRPSQKQLPTADTIDLSSEVLQLLERLNRNSKLRWNAALPKRFTGAPVYVIERSDRAKEFDCPQNVPDWGERKLKRNQWVWWESWERMNDRQLRHRETTGAIIIDTFGRYLFQLRDNVVGITNPGKIGLFGGHREGDETFLECVVREIHEEIGYFVTPDRFEHLGRFEGEDIDNKRGTIHGHLFVVQDIPVHALAITEGSLLIVEPLEINEIEARFAPTTRLALKAYLNTRQKT
jgi:8-oxo-dGTP diphosphatase